SIADASGFRLGKIVTLYENSDPTPMGYGGMGGAMEVSAVKQAVPPSIEPGSQKTEVQVTLTYEILQ
ncbi:MAG: SIMPL domain-containing protein, partial [Candidatus Moraniibacteriota bacterium]